MIGGGVGSLSKTERIEYSGDKVLILPGCGFGSKWKYKGLKREKVQNRNGEKKTLQVLYTYFCAYKLWKNSKKWFFNVINSEIFPIKLVHFLIL